MKKKKGGGAEKRLKLNLIKIILNTVINNAIKKTVHRDIRIVM